MKPLLLHKGTIVTAEEEFIGSIFIEDGKIADILHADDSCFQKSIEDIVNRYPDLEIHDVTGKHVMAGGIDAHVHFREPGLTHKADIATESAAALAGGVTSVFDMPNTVPPTISADALRSKMDIAERQSKIKIGFHIGATNRNADEICRIVQEGDKESGIGPEDIAGIKVFMGSSTGNMLVDETGTLEKLFKIKGKPVLVHCEDEATIKENLEKAKEKYGDEIPFEEHEHIRSRKACIKSSIKALELAIRHGTCLVLCHISTKEELEMVRAAKLSNPEIIAETSCNYLWFSNKDYHKLQSRLKCNPSVKTESDKEALRTGILNGTIDTIGSDHAPHLLSEKEGCYTKVPSGIPSVQQSLPILITIAEQESIPLPRIASVFSEKAADIYGLKRGKLRKGYDADIVVFDKNRKFIVTTEELIGKCRWSPYEGETLQGYIEKVFINGEQLTINLPGSETLTSVTDDTEDKAK